MSNSTLDLAFVDAKAVESIDNAATVKITIDMLDVGQFIPQGDVALKRLRTLPKGAVRIKRPSAQIVEGTTTGSRHVWDSLAGIEVYDPPERMKSPLVGRIYVLSKERTLTHPEHGHHVYPKGFIGVAIYQRQFAEELRRVVD
ncbi:MAG: hypothetical protein AB7I57_22850 [Pirellulales bacterium]